jgi:5-methylcytosine-specific restriction endonuclease McrA
MVIIIWNGGSSFEPYPPAFNKQLKDRVRARDNFICQRCGVPELECNQKLAIHHIDYDKKNCEIENLIALCNGCNRKVNYNRERWTEYFKEKIGRKKVNELLPRAKEEDPRISKPNRVARDNRRGERRVLKKRRVRGK